ncbi:MAG: extracellular solute-binding protein [Thermoleophilia bacterium]|nr:extracellular solute-binding protein [Thermoleophilia bacterium]
MTRRQLPLLIALVGLAALIAGACGGSNEKSKLVVYSGREQELVEPLYAQFTKDTGIELDVRWGESPELAATIREEGDASPADIFYAQDAGSIGIIDPQLSALPPVDLDLVDPRYRDPAGLWVGVTGRIRVLAYNTDRVQGDALPASVIDLASPDWKLGDVGVAPTNASFVGFVSALRETIGDEQTQAFLDGLAQHVKTFEKNGQIVDAIASGEIDTGLVNHYYLYEKRDSDPNAPLANHYFDPTDVGSLVNVSAVGILSTTKHKQDAETFVHWLLTEGQVFFANDAEEREYPLNAAQPGLERAADLPPLAEHLGPDVDLAKLGENLESTIAMIRQAGLVS